MFSIYATYFYAKNDNTLPIQYAYSFSYERRLKVITPMTWSVIQLQLVFCEVGYKYLNTI